MKLASGKFALGSIENEEGTADCEAEVSHPYLYIAILRSIIRHVSYLMFLHRHFALEPAVRL